MPGLLDAFWRAAAYCLHPRVILWSLAPLAIAGGSVLGLGWWYWEPAVDGMRAALHEWSLLDLLFDWLQARGLGDLRALVAPLLVVALALPVVVVFALVLVALLMTPAIVDLVAQRRFAGLEARRGASWLHSLAWTLLCTLGALLALLLSVPLWFVPPLVLVLPPLIWGWLGYRLFAFDALARHASAQERQHLMRVHRLPLLTMGIITGYVGAAPTLLWAFGAATVVLAPLLLVASVWLYTLVFAFAAAWFSHYCLGALQRLRADEAAVADVVVVEPPVPLPSAPKESA